MRRIRLNGIVQGVGFRPFVYRTAMAMGIRGTVLNSTSGVVVEAEGPADLLDEFAATLESSAPPAARVESVTVEFHPDRGFDGFEILMSQSAGGDGTLVSPDLATCADCIAEMRDPGYFRYGYPFINCTNCGPRFSIIESLPYDRPATSMRGFPMCGVCAAEYRDPLDRRFHAQPVACPACGPRFRLLGSDLQPIDPPESEISDSRDPVLMARRALLGGSIVAVKGIGGFHLACRADMEEPVMELRLRKRRPHKPFAVMCLLSRICDLVDAGPEDLSRLSSPAAPIIILPRRRLKPIVDSAEENSDFSIGSPSSPGYSSGPRDSAETLGNVAPFNPGIGVFLPYAPVHHLLLGEDMPFLVMTSGNRSGEPIADDPADLAGLADFFLDHDRPILNRCDDSVLMPGPETCSMRSRESRRPGHAKGEAGAGKAYLVVRRSRGLVPEPMPLPMELSPVLGCGAEMKLSFSLASGRTMFTSPYIGENSYRSTMDFYEKTLARFRGWFGIDPEVVACDLQPDFGTSRYASELAEKLSLPLVRVQHHHAHTAAVMAENKLSGRVLGISLDGTGMGIDGSIWGGEVLSAGYEGFDRLFSLEPMPLPGGDSAVRHPARIALAWLTASGVETAWLRGLSETERKVIARQTAAGLNVFMTSSVGRLFDCAAAMMGLFPSITFEAQAAMAMEFLCYHESGHPGRSCDEYGDPVRRDGIGMVSRAKPYRFELEGSRILVGPLLRDLAADIRKGIEPARISSRFHRTVASMFIEAALRARASTGLTRVALSGGCLQNRILAALLGKGLTGEGFEVYNGRTLPPNDGAVSAGQAAIAGFSLDRQ